MGWDGEWPERSERPGHHRVRPRRHCFPRGPGCQPLAISKDLINSLATLPPPHTVQHRLGEAGLLAGNSTEGEVLLCWVKMLPAPSWGPRTGRFLAAEQL